MSWREGSSNNVAGSSHDPLQSPAVASGAVSKPGGDAASQDALHSAGVEGSEDSGARSKLPQPSQEEAVQSCVYREYRSGLKTQPWGAPVLRTSGDEVSYCKQTTLGGSANTTYSGPLT